MSRSLLLAFWGAVAIGLAAPAVHAQPAANPGAGHYRNFRVAIYVPVDATRRLADRAIFEREFDRAQRQTHFDKVYVEAYRDGRFATDDELARVKAWFQEKGVQVSGGITLAKGSPGGQFGTFDYEDPADRATCERAVRLAARHFDTIILDDFFFYNTKTDLDIAAKGQRSWTQYRLEKMHEVARDLVLGPAKQVNPRVKVIIKFPNWYEHFQANGFDLDAEPKMFDGIYTGTETRDPIITDQLLQPYESYEVYRYFANIAPGRNGGGWVDTYDTRYVDRYAEQLWSTMFAKAPEITLFNWFPMAEAARVEPGDRDAWAGKATSFNWDEMVRSYRPATGGADPGPGWGQAAGYALRKVDAVVGLLGKPIGIPSYKPYQSSGEDFLQNYLGGIGLPIEMTPNFPSDAPVILLTESAKQDPQIVARIKAQLVAGKTVVITSGLLQALQGQGIEDIAEIEATGRKVLISDYVLGYGAGHGAILSDEAHHTPVLFPEIKFFTNDSWGIVRGVANDKGFPVMVMNRYSKGTLMVLTIPDNPGDLYNLPPAVTSAIKTFMAPDFPVRIEGEPRVALYAYDNGTFVVQSFRATDSQVTVVLPGEGRTLSDAESGAALPGHPPAPPPATRRATPIPPQTRFDVTLPPHSFRVFRIGG